MLDYNDYKSIMILGWNQWWNLGVMYIRPIQSWGSKKKKKDIRTLFTLISTNNNYTKKN